MFKNGLKCDRCGKESNTHIISKFNTEEICMECKAIEKEHPKYKEACDIEHAEVVKGNYNFPGIGKPSDL